MIVTQETNLKYITSGGNHFSSSNLRLKSRRINM